METIILKTIKEAVKNWYIPLIVGLFFVVVSILAFAAPTSSLLALSIFFALSFLFGGLSEIIFSIANRHQMENWGWTLSFGIITFIVGLSLTIHPKLSISVLAFYIGFGILFRSVAAVSFALDLKRYGNKKWGALLALGFLGAIVSFILIWNPVFVGLSIVLLIALSFLFAGLFSIFFSLQLRKLHQSTKSISSELKERYNGIMKEISEEMKD